MYNEEINKLLSKLNDVQKYFIEDVASEGLNTDDIEFEQMLNERALSNNEKQEIYQFYSDKASLITRLHFESLDEMDKNAIEDLLADNLYPGDPEFNQLLNERSVNKDKIYKYFDYKKDEFLLNYSRDEKDFINKLIKDGITIDNEEFDKKIKETNYDKDKIIRYINNINWINNTNNYIDNVNKEKEIKKEEEKDNKNKINDEIVNDDVEIDDKKRELFNEIQENLKKKEDNKNKDISKNETFDKYNDPYEGMDYYERLSAYAKEKEKHPSNLDSYDDELTTIKRKEKEIQENLENKKKINNLKLKRNWLYSLKQKLASINNNLGDEEIEKVDSKKMGFIDLFTISIVVIILGVLFTSIIKLFSI